MPRPPSSAPAAPLLLLAAVLQASLSGCETFASATPLPATKTLIERLPTVQNSTQSPCWQQRQIAAQNSYVATVKSGRETVYGAPCDVDKKPADPKTS